MVYEIYFDESNKLDQPDGKLSYYGALGANGQSIDELIIYINDLYTKLNTKDEMHFVNYTSDTQFEKYFRTMNYVVEQDINFNIMIVNKQDATKIARQMGITLLELRELFYVKIPERLFYGMTRDLSAGNNVKIVIDENSEYEKLNLERKIMEQMNAHSAYRNKGYNISEVAQVDSEKSIPIQIIDIFMGIIIFLLENEKLRKKDLLENVSFMVKSDLIYRFLIHNDNLNRLHQVVKIYKWGEETERIIEMNLSDYTGNFILYKTQFDISEMNRLADIMLNYPNKDTKFYRERMGYKNRQLKTLQGYMDELRGEGRNSFYT